MTQNEWDKRGENELAKRQVKAVAGKLNEAITRSISGGGKWRGKGGKV